MIGEAQLRIIVVTYFPGDTLDAFLTSLARATSVAHRVVIVDNGRTLEDLAEIAHRHGAAIVDPGSNLGYGRAANLGAMLAVPSPSDSGTTWEPNEQWIVVANPDIVLDAGALDQLLAAADRWPEAGAFGPALRDPDGTRYPSGRVVPSLVDGIGHAALGWWWPSNRWSTAYRDQHEHDEERPCGWLSGAFLLVRRSAFEHVTGFDPGYFMYVEDLDLGWRLGLHGLPSVLVPDAGASHHGGHSTSRQPELMAGHHHRSTWRFVRKRYPGWVAAPIRGFLGAGIALRSRMTQRR